MVKKEQVVVGAHFRFKTGDRHVTKIENGQVHWVYVDGVKRFGQKGGNQRLKHFANEAIEEYGSAALHKAIVRDAFSAGLNPQTKTEKLVALASLIVFLLFIPTIVRWFF